MPYKIDGCAKIAVIGHGSWATALVKIILENEKKVGWYIRNNDVLQHIKKYKNNPKYLSDVRLSTSKLKISDNINEIVEEADIIVVAIPSAFVKNVLESLTVDMKNKFIISAVKGIIPDQYVTVAEYFNQKYDIPFEQIGIVTGPCHAEEVALRRLSYLTVVTKHKENAEILKSKFKTKYINVSCSSDIYGTEYATVLKNIYAIAVGICKGLGYGDNFTAVLISNAAMEMKRFLDSSYPSERDTNASAYLGDLLVTSYSQFSRNRTFGMMIGKGYSVKNAQIEMSMIAEGYYGAHCIVHINLRYNVDMPIAETVYKILYKNVSVSAAIANLTKKLI